MRPLHDTTYFDRPRWRKSWVSESGMNDLFLHSGQVPFIKKFYLNFGKEGQGIGEDILS